jgi:cellulose synthase/poly-beta-1,6-N-acetylglucosamine synthase-like glycosyltransferase
MEKIIFYGYITLSIIFSFIIFLLCVSVLQFHKKTGEKIFRLKKTPKVSIIIPTFNLTKRIEDTLKSVSEIDYPNKEIIIPADGNIENEGIEIAKKYGAKLVLNKKRLGKPKASNIAVKKSKGGYILFLDDDTTVEKDIIKKLLSRMGENVRIVIPKYRTKNVESVLQKLINMEELILQTSNKISTYFEGTSNVIRGCCFLVKKDVFNEIGGFKQTLTEDIEFSANLRKNGYRIVFEHNALACTEEHEILKTWFRHKKRCGKGAFYTFLHHKKFFLTRPSLIFYLILPFLIHSAFFIFMIYAFLSSDFQAVFFGILLLAFMDFIQYTILLLPEVKNFKFRWIAIFVFIYLPMVLLAYFVGILSGIKDKFLGRDELIFKDW